MCFLNVVYKLRPSPLHAFFVPPQAHMGSIFSVPVSSSEPADDRFLLTALGDDYADHIFKHLHPSDVASLERSSRAITPLLRFAIDRMNDASKGKGVEGATFVVLGANRAVGQVTWSKEFGWIRAVVGSRRYAVKRGGGGGGSKCGCEDCLVWVL